MKYPAHSFALFLLFSVATIAHAQVTEATIEIDFGTYLGDQKSLSGIIHGADPRPDTPELSLPAFENFIAPLDFRIWSTGHDMTSDGFLEMIHDGHPDARAFMRVGAGLVQICPFEGERERPYLDFEDYKTYVTCVATWARDNNVDVLDIWNEPNQEAFLGNGIIEKRDLFFQTFKIAHHAIKEVWPDAVIAGPSLGKTNQESWLLDFMIFCDENQIEVPILTWHENGTIWNTDWLPDLPQKLQDARADYIDSGDYPHVNVQEIVINEAVSEAYDNIPANNLAVLYYLEQGGADAAARTCWTDDPTSLCFADTLNGLVTLPDENEKQEKRAMWWLHQIYNQTLEDRVLVTSDLENVVGIANNHYAMIGVYEEHDFPDMSPETVLDLTITLKNVDKLPHVSEAQDELPMKLYEIPYDDPYAPVPALPLKLEGELSINPGEIKGDGRIITFVEPIEVFRVFVLEY